MGLPIQAKGIVPESSSAKAKKNETKSVAAAPPQEKPKPILINIPATSKTSAKTMLANAPKSTPDKPSPTVASASAKPSATSSSAPSSRPSTQPRSTAVASTHATAPVSSFASTVMTGAAHLARLTAYWSGEGDYYTGRGISSTGVHLHQGHCAVDPRIIPYGSTVQIPGVGNYLAVDTGSAVISREAARETGHNSAERNALVIDLYFESRRDGERFAASGPKYASISWSAPRSTASNQDAHGLAAE